MVKCQDVMQAMERIAPRRLAEEWDNPGLLVGSPHDEVRKILVALDVREETVERAIEDGCDLIVAHHPLIFRALKALRTDDATGCKIARLIKADIAVFAAHTNLDSAAGGVNDVLAERLELHDVAPLVEGAADSEPGLGRIGSLRAEFSLEDFAALVKEKLGLSSMRVACAGERRISRVALCGGSGAEFVGRAAAKGADAYVTGDVKYHDAERAIGLGIHVLDAGHFATEQPIIARLAERLKKELGDGVEIVAETKSSDFFKFIN
ncbi:Nif3-like dinuclear metal center hexameric protein [uncultured Selenomonas sp.]|uniref:Nif3-like dinuclear metal center hexameric protein n=1 Tax=uncultured Selenomonas sp. TaxID=159275 RepID=UPI0026252468|nr:Nif3-like dinuclear metal center hexameric protein [uncultured Selenomonas sp.]